MQSRPIVQPSKPNGMANRQAVRRVALVSAAGAAVVVGFPSSGIGRQTPPSGGGGTPAGTAKAFNGGGSGYRLYATGDRILVGQTAFIARARPQVGIQGGTMGLKQMQAARENAAVATAMKSIDAKIASYQGNDPRKIPANDGTNSWMKHDKASDKFISPEGLKYKRFKDGKDASSGMPHILKHTIEHEHKFPKKDGVPNNLFKADPHNIPPLLDEAWKRKKTQTDSQSYVIDMGKDVVGTRGETHLKIVMRKRDGMEVLTAYPCHHEVPDKGCWRNRSM